MAVGFAAFSQRLEIGDTTTSDSNWNVYIKSVEAEEPVGNATGSGQVVDRATAHLTTTLSSPGDSVTYTVTVANEGNVDAILDYINFYGSNDDSVISYYSDGIDIGDELPEMSEIDFTIIVEYNPDMTGTATEEQKDNSLYFELIYIQNTGEGIYGEPSDGDWALVLDNSANSTTDSTPLVFVRTAVDEIISEGDTYASDQYGTLTVLGAYTGFESNRADTPWDVYAENITSVSFEDEFHLELTNNYFASLTNCKKVDLTNVDFSQTTDMTTMFQLSSSLETIIFPDEIDTSRVISFANLFDGCSSLKTIDVSGFDTENATDMFSMFRDCSALENLDISSFNTANVIDMGQMFSNTSLTNITFGEGWNTSSVIDMSQLFYNSNSITLDCSAWNVDNVTIYYEFNESENGTITTITPPVWRN